MQTTSQTWKTLWASGAAKLEARATIGGTTYTDEISAPVIRRALMQELPSVGNVVSATCLITLRTTNAIAPSAGVLVEMRLTDSDNSSEWLPAGTFYIAKRYRDPSGALLTLECYDALLKANAVWTPSAGSWPRSMSSVAAELAALLGLTQDSRNALAAYTMTEPEAGTTIRDALSAIGAANGGSWIVSPAGLLRLVPLRDAATAAAASDAAVVQGVLNNLVYDTSTTVTGLRYSVDGAPTLLGTDTGAVIDMGENGTQAQSLYDVVVGMTYQGYSLVGAIYDPAAELGDGLAAGASGEIRSLLCAESITLGPLVRGDVSAPATGGVVDEYPYIGGTANKMLIAAKAYTNEVTSDLDTSLDQQSIFNRLTNNGTAQGMYLSNGQLYVNASYISTGYLSDANNRNHWDLVSGEFVTTRGKIGSWTLSNGALTRTGGDYMYSYDISINPNHVQYKLENIPNDWTEQCILTHEGLSFGYKEGSLQYCNSKMFFGGEYGANNEPVSYVGLRADGPVASGEDRSVILRSGNSSSPGLNVYAEMYVDGDVTMHVPLPVASGGTGANTAAAARANLGALGASDVVNNLTSQETQKPLSAAQGKVLNDKLKDRAALYTGAAVPDNSTSYSLSEPYTRFEYILINVRTNVDYQTMLVKTDDITSSSNYMFSAFQNNQTGLTTAFSYMAACVVTFTDTMHFKVNGSWTNVNWILKPVNIWGINRK